MISRWLAGVIRLFLMIRIVVILAVMLGASTADAALPPFWQRTAEIGAILDSGDVAAALMPHGPIDSIERIETDHYRVRSGRCALEVLIVDDPSAEGAGMPGPRHFKVELGALVCN